MSRTQSAPSIAANEPLTVALRDGRVGSFEAVSNFAGCLSPLLEALGWRGELRHLLEAMPHFASSLDLPGLRNVLAELGFPTRPVRARLGAIDMRHAPCLFVPDDGAPVVFLRADGEGTRIFDSERRYERLMTGRGPMGTAYFIAVSSASSRNRLAAGSIAVQLAQRFRGLAVQLVLLTAVIDLLALAIPLFGMAIYDFVIGQRAPEILPALLAGIGLALAFDCALRLLRSRLLAYAAGRVEFLVGTAVLRQILHLPLNMTDATTIGAQVARLREFDALREFFSGPLASIVLELPFTVMFIVAIWIVAGPLVLVPITLIAAFIATAAIVLPALRRAGGVAGQARSARNAFVVEMLGAIKALREIGGGSIWFGRYRELSATAATTHRQSVKIGGILQTISQELMLAAGAATLAIGAMQIINGQLSVGGLVAAMALVWRVLGPLQAGLVSLVRAESIRRTLLQLDQLLRLPVDREPRTGRGTHRTFVGDLDVSRIAFRYRNEGEPALLGIGFSVRSGELVAITGGSGAGKSSLLKIIAGLYLPQAGGVTLDGIDIRQLDRGELTSAIAYLPQTPQLFYGTIAQNLRLAEPTASDEELMSALDDAGALEEVLRMPDGIHTRIGDREQQDFSGSLARRIGLASIYLRRAAVLLLDEPAQNLDEMGDAALIAMLQRLKGQRTVILVTHRPSHMRICDRVIQLEGGRALESSPVREMQNRIAGAMK